ncbi:MAG TPA: DUF992 domain-containing protein, partial [Bradyrhizobium sp.]|nr:DUF992 domain-containing protein [Bradyrhizobium sp.]
LDDLAGNYTHASGAGDNVLTGGTNATVALHPLDEKDPAPPPVKIESLEIRPVNP